MTRTPSRARPVTVAGTALPLCRKAACSGCDDCRITWTCPDPLFGRICSNWPACRHWETVAAYKRSAKAKERMAAGCQL